MKRHLIHVLGCVVAGGLLLGPRFANAEEAKAPTTTTAPATRPAPKAISQNVTKGLAWLAKAQLEDGSWGQGEESQQMGGGAKLAAQPNVADTCMAVMALYRSGSTPAAGDYKDNILKGVKYVCAQIEEADDKSLSITKLTGTRTQQKLGTYIDTFLAAQMLGELKNVMADDTMTKRVDAAVAKVVKKIELNQKEDGRWANAGWAPTLAQGQAAKAINTIVANGGKLDEGVRQKAEQQAVLSYNSASGKGGGKYALAVGAGATTMPAATFTGGDAAGVELYTRGAQLAAMNASNNNNNNMRRDFEEILASATTQPEAKEKARQQLARFDAADQALDEAQKDVVARMADKKFVAGFGSNGGEEFLSYLNIGEGLVLKGGETWSKWDEATTANLNNVQNTDGSWSGHHCITGRTFCTSAALMVLTIDRAPQPVAKKIEESKK